MDRPPCAVAASSERVARRGAAGRSSQRRAICGTRGPSAELASSMPRRDGLYRRFGPTNQPAKTTPSRRPCPPSNSCEPFRGAGNSCARTDSTASSSRRSSVLVVTWARLCGAACRDHHRSGSHAAGDIPAVIGLPQSAHRVPHFVSATLSWSVPDRR